MCQFVWRITGELPPPNSLYVASTVLEKCL